MTAFQCSILTFAESQLEEVERPQSFRFFKLGAKTTEQVNYMMEAFDRQVVDPEGEGAAGNELPDEEDMPEGVRRYFRNSKLRVSFTYSQNFQFLVKKSMDVGGRRVFILKSVSGQMTDLWVEAVSNRVVQLFLRPTLQGIEVQAVSLGGRVLAEAKFPPGKALKNATAALLERMDLSSVEASHVKFLLGRQAAEMDRPLRTLSTVLNDLKKRSG